MFAICFRCLDVRASAYYCDLAAKKYVYSVGLKAEDCVYVWRHIVYTLMHILHEYNKMTGAWNMQNPLCYSVSSNPFHIDFQQRKLASLANRNLYTCILLVYHFMYDDILHQFASFLRMRGEYYSLALPSDVADAVVGEKLLRIVSPPGRHLFALFLIWKRKIQQTHTHHRALVDGSAHFKSESSVSHRAQRTVSY